MRNLTGWFENQSGGCLKQVTTFETSDFDVEIQSGNQGPCQGHQKHRQKSVVLRAQSGRKSYQNRLVRSTCGC